MTFTLITIIISCSNVSTNPKVMGDYLINYANRGDLQAVRNMLNSDVDINFEDSSGNTALYYASKEQHNHVALHWAAIHNNAELAKKF